MGVSLMNAIRCSTRALAAAAMAGCLLCVSTSAAAQSAEPIPSSNGNGFDLRLFRPAVDSKGQFTINGTDILGAGDLSFGFVGDVGFGLLRIGGMNNAPLMDNQISGVLSANVGIGNVVVIGAQLPVHLFSGAGRSSQTQTLFDGIPTSGPGGYNPPGRGLSYQGLGDITLHAKLRWLRVEYFPVGLAIILQGGWGPTGGPRSFAGEPGGFVWPSVALEWRPARRWRVDFNLGARVPFAAGSTIGRQGGARTTYGPSATFGAGVSWRVIDVLDLVAETYGQAYLTGLGDLPASLPWETVAGLKVFVQRNSYLMVGGGTRVIPGALAAADARAFVGIVFEPSIGDTDGDGYRDDVDQCITDPEDFDNFQDDDGCSDPDNDRDSLLDVDDQCPIIPEDRDGDQDSDGCPEGQESDRDGDGILDQADRCADEPEDRDGFQDQDGCPDRDNDQDGILDTDDLCPNDAEDRDNFEDTNGCPDPDNDRDRIVDVRDRCPNDPETYNGTDDEDGCPDTGQVVVEEGQIRILQAINFETNSARIRPESMPIVEAVARTLIGNPQIELVEVQGHADERGNDEHNLRLTRDRAAAVVEALVERGVERSRLHSAGYGELCRAGYPPVPGQPPLNAVCQHGGPRWCHSERAWRHDRRVVFIILRTSDGPTNVRIVCPEAEHLIPEEDRPYHNPNP